MDLQDMLNLPDKAAPKQGLFRAMAILLIVYPFNGGLYAPWQWGVALLCNGTLLTLVWISTKHIRLLSSPVSAMFLAVIAVGAVCNLKIGLDPDASWMGMLRLCGWMLFALLVLQWPLEQRRRLLMCVPVSGAVAVAVSLLAGLNPVWRPFFYEAGRLAGPFQYANSFALFLLIGLMMLPSAWPRWLWGGIALLLLFGIVATGSRSGLILLVLWFAFALVRHHQACRVLPLLGIIAIAGIALALWNDGWVFARFLKTNSLSTVWGRLLYNKDGIRLLLQRPLGVGYLGWFYLQRMIQTGVYNVRYVHNDWLQMALDYGLPAALALLGLVIWRLRKGVLCPMAAVCIALHCLLDPDLEFQCLMFFWILALTPCTEVPARPLRYPLVPCLFAWIAMLLILPRTAADISYHFGGNLASHLSPADTEYATQQMLQASTLSQAAEQARVILDRNAFVPIAWQILAEDALSRGAYEDMATAQRQAVLLLKYDQTVYDEAMDRLQIAQQMGWDENSDLEQKIWLLDFSDATLDSTDSLGWVLRDVPEIGFPESTKLLLRMQQRVSNASTCAG